MTADVASLCGQFEGILVRQLLTSAGVGRSSISASEDGWDDGTADAAGDTMQSLFVESLAGAIERGGGIGLGAALQNSLGSRSGRKA
ncbi:MAG: hypothetical protein M3T49_02655 [Candidatus Eremiobacteraeota bacterium]|nr:hypothetical protein [Candidatus Eremiobacteraeota bacterium]